MFVTGQVLKAAAYAAEAHKFQTRKSDGSAYICHPLRVAHFLETCAVQDAVTLVAAVLHDVVEDTSATIEDIRAEFGDSVASVVAEVSDDRSLSAAERKRAQLEHIEAKTKRARQVKAADMYDNLSSLLECPPPGWSLERTRGYFVWKYLIWKRGIRYRSGTLLDTSLAGLFKSSIADGEGGTVPVIPPDTDLDAELERYLSSLAA